MHRVRERIRRDLIGHNRVAAFAAYELRLRGHACAAHGMQMYEDAGITTEHHGVATHAHIRCERCGRAIGIGYGDG